jgi:hypothetical protein
MLQPILRKLIPHDVRIFPKLQHGEPYHFDSWSHDRNGMLCLYYWFDGVKQHKKRIPVSEITAAVQRLRDDRAIKRDTFKEVCPVAESAGPCGFTVVGRIFEALGVAVYSQRDGFRLTDADKVMTLLAE